MKTLNPANDSYRSGSLMNEAHGRFLRRQLTRVIAINLICLVIFTAFCALMTFGSLSLLVDYWNEHRAVSEILIMIAIVSIPSVIELTASRMGFWQR